MIASQSLQEIVADQGLVEQEALGVLAVDSLEVIGLFLGFDTFGDYVLVEFLGHLDHVSQNDFVVGVRLADIVQQRLVDLDDADVVVLEHVQGRITGAKVIDGHSDTILAHDVDEFLHGNRIVKIGDFGQFDFDVLAVDFVLAQGVENAVGKVFVAQVQLREVRRNAYGGNACLEPVADIATGGLENVEVQFADGAFAFQNGNEVHGRDDGLVADPACQGFGAVDLLVVEADLGLVEHDQFAVAHGVVEFSRDFPLVDRLNLHFLGKVHHVAGSDDSGGLHGGCTVVQGVADNDVFFDGVDTHARLEADIHGLGALACGQFANGKLVDKFLVMAFSGQNKEVVAAEAGDQFRVVEELENLFDVHLEGEVAHIVAHGLVDVLEILEVNKVGGVVLEVVANELLGEREDAGQVVCPGHGVRNGGLAGVAHEPCTARKDKEVPAEELDDLPFAVGKGVPLDGVGLEGERSLLAGSHGLGKVRVGGLFGEGLLVVVGGKFSRKPVGGKLANRCVEKAVYIADICIFCERGQISG